MNPRAAPIEGGLAGEILSVLERHGSRMFARQALNLGLKAVGLEAHEVRPEHVERLVEETMFAFRAFLEVNDRQRLWIELVELCERHAPPTR